MKPRFMLCDFCTNDECDRLEHEYRRDCLRGRIVPDFIYAGVVRTNRAIRGVITKQRKQIEAMKNCSNCKNNIAYCDGSPCDTCSRLMPLSGPDGLPDNWRLQ